MRDSAPPGDVVDFHHRSDVDSKWNAQHHTLGTKPTQAAPGNHNHDNRYALIGAGGGEGTYWHTGSGAPAGSLGEIGDFYLNTTTDEFFEKTGATTWTLRADFTGDPGPTGPTGSTGPAGAQGIQGIQGPAGTTGSAGAPGEKWFSGSGAPAGATGIIGDWYLDTANGDVYEKTGASTWTLRGNIKGPTGATGSQGPQGIQGIPGTSAAFFVGEVRQFGLLKTLPSPWFKLNGGTISAAANPVLFAAWGYTYGGSGDNMGVPDATRRYMTGPDSTWTKTTTDSITLAADRYISGAHDHSITNESGHQHAAGGLDGNLATNTRADAGANRLTGPITGNVASAGSHNHGGTSGGQSRPNPYITFETWMYGG